MSKETDGGTFAEIKPGIYVKGKRRRTCLGREGWYVYYTFPSRPGQTTMERIDLWRKWAKGAEYIPLGGTKREN